MSVPTLHDDDLDGAPVEHRAYPKSVQAGIPKLGLLPPGWERRPMGDLLQSVKRPVTIADDTEYQLVTARRSRGGIVARERSKGKAILTKTQFETCAGDFLISRRQIAHGACGIVPPDLDGALVSGEYDTLLPTQALNSAFLRHLPHSTYFQQTCFHSSIGVHVEKLIFKLDEWLRWPFDVPPRAEQQRIAAVLDAWDEAISKAERLAGLLMRSGEGLRAKLTHQGDEHALIRMADVIFSGVDKRIVEGERSVRLCNYMDVLRNRRLAADVPFSVGSATQSEAARFMLRRDDVVFTKDSETAEEIAEAAYVAEEINEVVCGYHLGIARPRPGFSGAYISHAMRDPRIRKQFVIRANGAVRFGLTLQAVEQVWLPAPSFDRQLAIAAALDAADDEATSYVRMAALLRHQKRGLMQKLLTGEWRVPAAGDPFAPGCPAVGRLEAAE